MRGLPPETLEVARESKGDEMRVGCGRFRASASQVAWVASSGCSGTQGLRVVLGGGVASLTLVQDGYPVVLVLYP